MPDDQPHDQPAHAPRAPVLQHVRDAWRTLVPHRDDPHGPLSPLLLLLTLVTGLVDALSYLVLGHVFVANMTGNVVFLGFAVAGTASFTLAASATAILAFSVGALLGGRVASTAHGHRGRLVFRAVLLQTGVVLVALACAWLPAAPFVGPWRYVLITLLSVAMGLQNAAARALAVPDLTTTVLTLTITGISADSAAAGGHGSRLGRRATSILAMGVGALVGALLVGTGDGPRVLTVVAALLVVATGLTWRLSRSAAPWAVASR